MIEVLEVYGVTLPRLVAIDRSKTFQEMFQAANSNRGQRASWSIDPVVIEKYDLHRRHITETVTIRGFANERGMATTTALLEMDRLGCVPAAIIHWLAFAALCPEHLDKDPKVYVEALGGGYPTSHIERMIAKKKAHPSTLEMPQICYPENISSGKHDKMVLTAWRHDKSKFKAGKYVFLAVAKQGPC